MIFQHASKGEGRTSNNQAVMCTSAIVLLLIRDLMWRSHKGEEHFMLENEEEHHAHLRNGQEYSLSNVCIAKKIHDQLHPLVNHHLKVVFNYFNCT